MRVASLHIYPVKGCAGIRLERMHLGGSGPDRDRRFMVVDEDRAFLTQREHPRLALVSTSVDGQGLELQAPGAAPLRLPPYGLKGATMNVHIWKSTVAARDQGDEAARWFSTALGLPCRLVAMPKDVHRPVDAPYDGGDRSIAFADGFPLLVTTTGSLADLNARLASPIPMDRFRPNLVVETDSPFAEDHWKRIQVGDLEVDLVKPCERCVVINVDQATAERGDEPLKTLATYRRTGTKGVVFGQNGVAVGEGEVRVGDPVVVL